MDEDKDNNKFSEEDYFRNIDIADNFETDEDFLIDVNESLKQQVN
jgi:hypothetical protein